MNLLRRKQILLQKRLQQNPAHLARAQHRNMHVRQLRGRSLSLYGNLSHVDSCLGLKMRYDPSEYSAASRRANPSPHRDSVSLRVAGNPPSIAHNLSLSDVAIDRSPRVRQGPEIREQKTGIAK
jgi:hypothetical protein